MPFIDDRIARTPPQPTGADPDACDVAIRGLTQSFGPLRAVDDLSLDAAPGEILCLLGPSGCGKSTLLRLIAGLQRPDAGTVALGGQEVTGPRVFVEPDRRRVGFMVQDYALFPHLSVIENVAFGLKRRRQAEARVRAADMLDRVGLSHLADRYPHMLSGGEQQRVALARALAPEPRLLLLDEPFSNLDRRTIAFVRRETIAILRAARSTVIVVTHDPEEAMELADRIVLMQAGGIVQAGPPADLYRQPNSLFAARFFGDLNEWPSTARGGPLDTPFGPVSAPGRPMGAALRVCFRPSAVRFAEAGTPARLLRRIFLGDRTRLTLETRDGFVIEALAEADFGAPLGSMVAVSVDPGDVFVFPEDGLAAA